MNSLTVLLVTYWNRHEYLLKSIDKLKKSSLVKKIIVVDNNSVFTSYEKIQTVFGEDKNIDIIRCDKNLWSAWGFKKGIQYFYEMGDSSNLLLLLDDDNLIEDTSIKELFSVWYDISSKTKDFNNNVMLLGNRTLRNSRFYDFYKKSNIWFLNNTFCNFHIKNIIWYIKSKLLNNKKPKANINPADYPSYWEVADWYYGWMFFHRDLIKKIGFPLNEMFLYWDDNEYAHRVLSHWGKIFFVKNCVVSDLEWSRNTSSDEKNYLNRILFWDQFRTYYSVRNRIFFERNYLVSCLFVYYFNMICFKLLLIIYSIIIRKDKNKLNNYKLIRKAINNWLNKKMGDNF